MIRVLFRCDANSTIGFGHFNRCLVVANELIKHGVCCVFVISEVKELILNDINPLFKLIEREWVDERSDAENIVFLCRKESINYVVVDDYRAKVLFQEILLLNKIQWLQFYSPFPDKILADIAVCNNPAVVHNDFIGKAVSSTTRCLLGLKYALIRDELQDLKPISKDKSKYNILLSFGGGDDRGAIEKCLDALNLLSEHFILHVVVVSGEKNPRNVSNKKMLCKYGFELDYFIQPDDFSLIYQMADLAVMAGGTSSYEAIFYKLPMIILSIADNQIEQSFALENIGVAQYIGKLENTSCQDVSLALSRLLANDAKLQNMRANAEVLVDGKGKERIVNAILGLEIL